MQGRPSSVAPAGAPIIVGAPLAAPAETAMPKGRVRDEQARPLQGVPHRHTA